MYGDTNMYRYGKKVDKNKRYTEREVRTICNDVISRSIHEVLEVVHSIAIMAYADVDTQKYTVRGEVFCKKDTQAFNELMNKYAEDYLNGDFKKSDVKDYRNDALKGLFDECKI